MMHMPFVVYTVGLGRISGGRILSGRILTFAGYPVSGFLFAGYPAGYLVSGNSAGYPVSGHSAGLSGRIFDYFLKNNQIIKYRVFLSDNFETLITPSILKISSFCKVVMTNQTGQFDNLGRKSAIYKKRNSQIHSKFTQYFACNHVFRESTDLDCH